MKGLAQSEPKWEVDWAHSRTPYRIEAPPKNGPSLYKRQALSPPVVLQPEWKDKQWDEKTRAHFHHTVAGGLLDKDCLQRWRDHAIQQMFKPAELGWSLIPEVMGIIAEYMDRPASAWRGPLPGLDLTRTVFWSRGRAHKMLIQSQTIGEMAKFQTRWTVVIDVHPHEDHGSGFSVGVAKICELSRPGMCILTPALEVNQDGWSNAFPLDSDFATETESRTWECKTPLSSQIMVPPLADVVHVVHRFHSWGYCARQHIFSLDFDLLAKTVRVSRDGVHGRTLYHHPSLDTLVPFVYVIGSRIHVSVDP